MASLVLAHGMQKRPFCAPCRPLTAYPRMASRIRAQSPGLGDELAVVGVVERSVEPVVEVAAIACACKVCAVSVASALIAAPAVIMPAYVPGRREVAGCRSPVEALGSP